MGKLSSTWRGAHLWVLIVCLLISLLIAGAYYLAERQESNAKIESISQTYAARTTDCINSIFHKTDTLAAVVKLRNGDIDEQTFDAIAKIVYEKDAGIRGIQYMPGAVVTYSYPLEGNEEVMGKNFFDIPERRADVQLAIDTRSIALSGPYNLIQGGLGLVARNPVFLTDSNGNEYFWGFSTIVLNLPDALHSAGLERLTENGYDYQMFSVNENGEYLVIDGNPDMDVSTATNSTIQVPNHEWTLAVKEMNPWIGLLRALLVLAICILISLFIWHRYRISMLEKSALRMRERFFSDVSHDMRTPLNAVINFASLGQSDDLSEKQKDEYFQKIAVSGDLLLELVNETLTLFKAESSTTELRIEPINLHDFMTDIITPVHSLAEKKRIDFSVDLGGLDDTVVLADRTVLQKTLLNLLSNAVKYTPEQGHVALTLHRDEGGKGIVFSVKDDGIGIGEHFLPHIFEPFTQERRAGYGGTGTGLGLSIVQQMVKLMHGQISVESKKNKGTEFTVTLPLQETDEKPQPTALLEESDSEDAENEGEKLLDGARILVCEDNTLNQEIACTLLESRGAVPATANDGQQGVEMFAESEPHTFDAILMDVRMPVMDGLQATQRIRSLDRPDATTVPIIAMTADAFESDAERCRESGMDAHIVKPIDVHMLFRTLTQQINRSRR